MKASACGLETEIYGLKDKEIIRLEKGHIKGNLNFREPCSNKIPKKIPIALYYKQTQKNPVEIEIFPESNYFGDAKKIKFFINEEYYEFLKEKGYAIARFCSGIGKLVLVAERIKNLNKIY